jgi:hypothetical protein
LPIGARHRTTFAGLVLLPIEPARGVYVNADQLPAAALYLFPVQGRRGHVRRTYHCFNRCAGQAHRDAAAAKDNNLWRDGSANQACGRVQAAAAAAAIARTAAAWIGGGGQYHTGHVNDAGVAGHEHEANHERDESGGVLLTEQME